MKRSVNIGLAIAILFIGVNCINYKDGPSYTCMNGSETFSSSFSSYGIPLTYLQRSVHGECMNDENHHIIASDSKLNFGHRFIWKNLIINAATGLVLVVSTTLVINRLSKNRLGHQ